MTETVYENELVINSEQLKYIHNNLTKEDKLTLSKIKKLFTAEQKYNIELIGKDNKKIKEYYHGFQKFIYLNIYDNNMNKTHLFQEVSNKNYLCKFKSRKMAIKYLGCSRATIVRAFNKGYIFVPDIFLPLLNQNHIDTHDSIIDYMDTSNLEIYYYRKGSDYEHCRSLKAGLEEHKGFTKLKIYGILARTL